MQTFLPYSSFKRSAAVLDRQRLGKQRVEVLQILNVFAGVSKGWGNHPITRMWTGSELWLVQYGVMICNEWKRQGFQDTCKDKIKGLKPYLPQGKDRPIWLGDPEFHRSHQSNLVRKNPERYGPLFPGVPDDLPYIWPV